MAHPQLSIVIPAYNESARIEHAWIVCCPASRSRAGMPRSSSSTTAQRTTPQPSFSAGWRNIPASTWSRIPATSGKGYSVRNGLLQAAGDIVMFTDADLSAPMEEAQRLIDAIDDGADVAIGSRWMDRTRQTIHQPLYRQFFGRCFNWVTRTIMGLPLQGHAVRLQGLQTRRRAGHLPPPDHRALGLRSRDSLHRPQAEVRHPRSPRHLGPRRAQPHELPQGRHEDARRHGAHPRQLRRAAATTKPSPP